MSKMVEGGEISEEKSLVLTPTWALATVVTAMVTLGFFFQGSLEHFRKWLQKTKRKSLLSAMEKIKEELMLFGLMSLLMGHWILIVSKICVKPSALSSRFFPCAMEEDLRSNQNVFILPASEHSNSSVAQHQFYFRHESHCPENRVPFASYESLEQLHRLMFVLGATHVSYSFIAVVLAMIKIYSWTSWENQAKTMAIRSSLDSPEAALNDTRLRRLSTFISHQASHPWSQHRVLVWVLCFSRQFWSSINQADYLALRFGFITRHQLPLTYDFHNYMLRSMEEEFRDIVGISVPLWIYAILCIFLDFHGTNIYFWLSFFPAILIVLIGTKLHRVVVKLAVEIMHMCPSLGHYHQFNLRDELFWFRRPRLLLRLIQLVSFQNAFEMATFLWSLWEIKNHTCFMDNKKWAVIRLVFGVATQFWFSFITFPLYVIVTQMGARFKKTVVSENVRQSLHGWKRRVRARQHSSSPLLGRTENTLSGMRENGGSVSSRQGSSSSGGSNLQQEASSSSYVSTCSEISECTDDMVDEVQFCSSSLYHNSNSIP